LLPTTLMPNPSDGLGLAADAICSTLKPSRPANTQISAVRFKSISTDSLCRAYKNARVQCRKYNRAYVAAKTFRRSPLTLKLRRR
jgi:hypothetical protein